MYGDLILFERGAADSTRVKRLPIGDTSGRDEAWLRDTLFSHPDVLPLEDIDASFGPLIPLCKELRTPAGPIDAAFINQHGRLTLVECKLWRNPEARRKVVAQILDYARAISHWTYSDLQRQVAAATRLNGNVPFELVKAHVPDIHKKQFVDATAKAIRQGRFLLIIAGDGIHQDIGAIAELINRNAASGFAFGLVEIALYGFKDGAIAIQPRVVARTQIIEKSIIVIRDGNGQLNTLQEDEVTESTEPSTLPRNGNALGESAKQAEYRRWWQPVIDAPLDDPDQEPPSLFWPNNVRAALPWPNTWILLFNTLGNRGEVGVCIAGRNGSDLELLRQLEPAEAEILAELPAGCERREYGVGDAFTYSIRRPTGDFANDSERKDWLAQNLNVFVNVFRPRIKQLTQSK